jgi:L-lactate dehydrogenase complex protein LldG
MSTDHLSTFESSLAGTATVRTTPAAAFGDTLADVVTEPAVGTPLPFDGVSYDDTPVTADPSPRAVRDAATGVTPAGIGIADYGTVTLPSRGSPDEVVALYPVEHVAVVAASDVVADMPAAYESLSEDFAAGLGTQILATGPSTTADMGALVQGVHGPQETTVVVLEDR